MTPKETKHAGKDSRCAVWSSCFAPDRRAGRLASALTVQWASEEISSKGVWLTAKVRVRCSLATSLPPLSLSLSLSLLPHSQSLIQSSQLVNSDAALRTHSIWQPRQRQLSHSATWWAKTQTIWCYHREKDWGNYKTERKMEEIKQQIKCRYREKNICFKRSLQKWHCR